MMTNEETFDLIDEDQIAGIDGLPARQDPGDAMPTARQAVNAAAIESGGSAAIVPYVRVLNIRLSGPRPPRKPGLRQTWFNWAGRPATRRLPPDAPDSGLTDPSAGHAVADMPARSTVLVGRMATTCWF